MELEIKIITRLETFLARKFGKKTKTEDEDIKVTFHTWRGNLYLTDIKLKGE